MSWLISIVLDQVINGAYIPKENALPPVHIVYHYGTFNQLFGQHTQSIGEM